MMMKKGYEGIDDPSSYGNGNIAIGSDSLAKNGSGSNNVVIGYESFVNNQNRDGNIGIGSYAGHNQDSASNILIIDNTQRADAGDEVNSAILYGIMSASAIDQRLKINAKIYSAYNSVPLQVIALGSGSGVAITEVSLDTEYAKITTSSSHGLSPGQAVIISGATSFPSLNGIYIISRVVNDTMFYFYFSYPSYQWNVSETGTVASVEQVSNLQEWQDPAGNAMSYIQPKDGAFVGSAILMQPITSASADYTMTQFDYTKMVTCTSASITISLPTAASSYSNGMGKIYNIKKMDATAYSVIVDGNGSETIDGMLTISISSQYSSMQLQSTGTEWVII
jgi:hypothetical protein